MVSKPLVPTTRDLEYPYGTEMVPLHRLAVQVWHADPRAFGAPEAQRACLALLDEAETARLRRFRFEADRTTYLVAHALLRSVLSLHAEVQPHAWRFLAGPHGKPSLAIPEAHRYLTFNLSHARGRVAVAVALDREVGVDVEDVARAAALERIADRYLSPVEVRALRALPQEARGERVLACWTLKESYLKARGTGLSLPLTSLTFHVDRGPAIRAAFDASTGDDPTRWSFARFAAGPGHTGALAIRRGPDEELSVCVREVRALPQAP